MESSNEWQLPGGVRPTRYALNLEPNLDTFKFDGYVSIDIEVEETTSKIVLNSAELEIHYGRITLESGSSYRATGISFDKERETATISFDSPIPAGTAQLGVDFTGELNDKLRGFYRSSYTDVDGNQRWMATTQFESTDARRAFPCWDEPAIKATFDVTLIIPEEMEVISNTEPVTTTVGASGKKSVRFAETPIMSTYLLAFIVGDLACVEDRTEDGVLMRVWATAATRTKAGSHSRPQWTCWTTSTSTLGSPIL